jgi:pyruvate,water dikinase
MLLEIGRRLQQAGVINEPNDVFWLHRAEIDESQGSLADQVEQRKELWRAQLRVTPPQLLPKGGWGDMFRKWMPAASEEQTGNVIKGIAGSMGTVTAPARVLGGPQDFGQMQPGDVLVASITTPAWTSLFAMASGVVTDIGGPLSHSSIVAREYGIPAVLGTAVATRLIHSGQLITVDGDAGVVRLLDGQEPSEIEPDTKSSQRRKLIAGATGAAAGAALTAWLVRRRFKSQHNAGLACGSRRKRPSTSSGPELTLHCAWISTSSAIRLPISNEAVAAGDGAFSTWT